jgi:hypothetical protein
MQRCPDPSPVKPSLLPRHGRSDGHAEKRVDWMPSAHYQKAQAQAQSRASLCSPGRDTNFEHDDVAKFHPLPLGPLGIPHHLLVPLLGTTTLAYLHSALLSSNKLPLVCLDYNSVCRRGITLRNASPRKTNFLPLFLRPRVMVYPACACCIAEARPCLADSSNLTELIGHPCYFL